MKAFKTFALIMACLMVASLVRNVWTRTNADVVMDSSREILKATEPFKQAQIRRAQHDSIWLRRAQQAEHDRGLAAAQIRSLGTQLEEARSARDTIVAQDSAIGAFQRAVFLADQRGNALDSAFQGCSERANLCAIRLDTLESALRRQVSVTGCKVLFIPCLSRIQSLEFGLLVGGLTGYVLTR